LAEAVPLVVMEGQAHLNMLVVMEVLAEAHQKEVFLEQQFKLEQVQLNITATMLAMLLNLQAKAVVAAAVLEYMEIQFLV
jgi:hypothetical protein